MSEGSEMINLTHLICRKDHIYKESWKTRFKQANKQKNTQGLESGVLMFQAQFWNDTNLL